MVATHETATGRFYGGAGAPEATDTFATLTAPNTNWSDGLRHYNYWHTRGDSFAIPQPKRGLIDYLSRLPIGWSGFTVSGSGSLTAELACSMYTIYDASGNVTAELCVNGVSVHSWVVGPPGGGRPGRNFTLAPFTFSVSSGDTVEMYFEPSPHTPWSLPVGDGRGEHFTVYGSLTPLGLTSPQLPLRLHGAVGDHY